MRVRRKGKNMEEERIEKIYEILNNIPVTVDNFDTIQKIRESLLNQDYIGALKKLEILSKEQKNDNKVEESYKQEEEESRNKNAAPIKFRIARKVNGSI